MQALEEQEVIKKIVNILKEENVELKKHNPDTSQRSRDKQGRFLPEQQLRRGASESESVRSIRLVKVPGTYGTFDVKERWLTDAQRTSLYIGCFIILMAIIF